MHTVPIRCKKNLQPALQPKVLFRCPVPQVEQIGSPTVVVIPPTDESIQPIAGDDELRMVFSILCS